MVIRIPAIILLWMLSSGAVGRAQDARPLHGTMLAQVRIQQHIIIRIPGAPRMSRASVPAASAPAFSPRTASAWEERRSEKCVKVQRLAAADVTRRDSVDLLLNDGKRMRARLGRECPALTFYRGFYLKPTADGMLCADRDSIRSRAGGECRIRGLRKLVPAD
jgi:hypothetical protein